MIDRQLELWMQATDKRAEDLQKQIDTLDERVGAQVERINLLMGDKQREQAVEQAKAKENGEGAEKFATPVQKASATRRAADKRAEERRS